MTMRVGDPDGHGAYGRLDREDGQVRCHECGQWWQHLATHARLAHGLTAAAYRQAHGLGATTPLVGDDTRARMRASFEPRRDQHLADLDAHRDAAAAAARSRSHTRAEPWAPEIRARRQEVGRATRSADLTPQQAALLGDGIDLQQWADAARSLRADGVTLAALARSADISPATVSQRLRRYPPRTRK